MSSFLRTEREIFSIVRSLKLELDTSSVTDDRVKELVYQAFRDHAKRGSPLASQATTERLLLYDLRAFSELLPAGTRAERIRRDYWKSDAARSSFSLFVKVNLLLRNFGGPRLVQMKKYRTFGLRKADQSTFYRGHLENLFERLLEFGERKLLVATANASSIVRPAGVAEILRDEAVMPLVYPRGTEPPAGLSSFHIAHNVTNLFLADSSFSVRPPPIVHNVVQCCAQDKMAYKNVLDAISDRRLDNPGQERSIMPSKGASGSERGSGAAPPATAATTSVTNIATTNTTNPSIQNGQGTMTIKKIVFNSGKNKTSKK